MNILQQLLGGGLSSSPQENVIKEQPIKAAPVDMSESVWGGLKINRPEFYKLKRGKGMGAGFGDGGGGGGLGFSFGGGKRSSPLHYMDSGLDGLNDLSQFPIPTYSEDPLYYQNVMNQQKNMDANGYWTGPKEHKPIVKVNDEWKFLKNLTPEDEAWVADTSKRFGEGIEENFLTDVLLADPALNAGGGMTGGPLSNFLVDPVLNAGGGMTGGPLSASVIRAADAIDAAGSGMTGGPLTAPADYQTPVQEYVSSTPVQEYVSSTPVQEYVSNNYDTGYLGTGNYSGMSYGL